MPLPKPPSRKGDLLHGADYEAQAAPKADKRPSKSRIDESPAQTALDLHDGGIAIAARAPA
ncbi:MAG: PhoH family protein, partial [Rubrivivax sp.]|nr:PhoH family protein [Rubrivivax sp.]